MLSYFHVPCHGIMAATEMVLTPEFHPASLSLVPTSFFSNPSPRILSSRSKTQARHATLLPLSFLKREI